MAAVCLHATGRMSQALARCVVMTALLLSCPSCFVFEGVRCGLAACDGDLVLACYAAVTHLNCRYKALFAANPEHLGYCQWDIAVVQTYVRCECGTFMSCHREVDCLTTCLVVRTYRLFDHPPSLVLFSQSAAGHAVPVVHS